MSSMLSMDGTQLRKGTNALMRRPTLQWDKDHFKFNFDVRNGPISVEWFRGAKTNITYNCLDRHVAAGKGDQTCFLWCG